MKKLGTRFGRPMNVEAAYFADSLYNAWHMEHIDCKNGVLLAISSDDREVRSPPSASCFPRACLEASCLNRAAQACLAIPRRRIHPAVNGFTKQGQVIYVHTRNTGRCDARPCIDP